MAPYLVYLFTTCAIQQAALGSAFYVAGNTNDNLGIFGGNEVSIKEAPFMAAVYVHIRGDIYSPVCGGSIIHKRFILTAAHCVGFLDKKNDVNSITRVEIGTEYLGSGKKMYVVKVICHKGFSFRTASNDICLLKLRDPVEFGANMAPLKLPDKNTDLEFGAEVNVTGWGYISNDDNQANRTDRRLRQATVTVASTETCKEIYPTWSSTVMCAGSTDHNFCKGDSGGPLTTNGVQVGIVSYFKGKPGMKCSTKYPGIYTKVASYLDWITTTITNNL